MGKRRVPRAFAGTKVAETEHSGNILREGYQMDTKTRSGKLIKRKVMELQFESLDSWAWNMRADWMIACVRDEILRIHAEAISLGVRADTWSRQPDVKRNPSRERGFNSGYFRDTLYGTKVTGSTTTANTSVGPNNLRASWLADEAARGVHYLFVEGRVEQAITAVLSEWIDAAYIAAISDPETVAKTAASLAGARRRAMKNDIRKRLKKAERRLARRDERRAAKAAKAKG